MNNSCVLIAGIGSFIGQNVAEYLTDHGIEVIGIYRNRYPTCAAQKVFSCNLAKDEFEKYLHNEPIDTIIHFAGQMNGDKICDYLDNTIGSTRRLIDYAEKAQIPAFIYISSVAVYGETTSCVNEFSDRINLSDYGMTKFLCERMLEDSHIKKRIVIRLPRTLGKGCDLSYLWLPRVTAQMMKNEDVYYTNPDLLYNNLLYVDDLSKFLLLLLEKEFMGFEQFVLGAKGCMRIIDILDKLKRSLNSQSQFIERPAEGPNTCYAIDSMHAQAYGFQSREITEIIEKFAKDVSTSIKGK